MFLSCNQFRTLVPTCRVNCCDCDSALQLFVLECFRPVWDVRLGYLQYLLLGYRQGPSLWPLKLNQRFNYNLKVIYPISGCCQIKQKFRCLCWCPAIYFLVMIREGFNPLTTTSMVWSSSSSVDGSLEHIHQALWPENRKHFSFIT